MERIGGGVDVEIRELHGEGRELVEPGESDVPADDDELGEIEHHVLQVRNEPPGFGPFERPGVADLRAERHAGIDARRVDRIVVPIIWRQVPQPRHDAHADKTLAVDPTSNLTHRLHGTREVDACEATKACWRAVDLTVHLVVADKFAFRPVPGRQKRNVDVRLVHRLQCRFDARENKAARPSGPAHQRLHPGSLGHAIRCDLRPDVDRAHLPLHMLRWMLHW